MPRSVVRFAMAGIVAFIVLTLASVAAASSAEWLVEVERGGVTAEVPGAAVEIADQPYILLRAIAEPLEGELTWIASTQEAIFSVANAVGSFRPGLKSALVNGVEVNLKYPVEAPSGRIALSAQDLRALGMRVSVDTAARAVKLGYPWTQVKSLSWSPEGEEGAAVLEVGADFRYSAFVLTSPDRLVIDVFDAELGPGLTSVDVQSGSVVRLRAALNRPGVVRIVADLALPTGYYLSYEPYSEESGSVARIRVKFNARITAMSLSESPGLPRLTIRGSAALSVPQVRQGKDGVYRIDIPSTTLDLQEKQVGPTGGPVEWITAEQAGPGNVRISLKLADGYSLIAQGGGAGCTTLDYDVACSISGIAVNTARGATTVTLSTSAPVDFRVFKLVAPDRIGIDLPGVWVGAGTTAGVGAGNVSGVRTGQFSLDMGRAVIDLVRERPYRVSISPDRRAITVEIAESSVFGKTVMIDPGHGGSDPGAVKDKVIEKDVNLDIALRLRSLLADAGANVVMTRDVDKAVELTDRSRLANELMPDVFISIHCNSVWNVFPAGTETYYYNVLPYSQELAALVHASLLKETCLLDRKVIRKDYYVIRETKSPSILVEVAFVSNEVENAKLLDPEFRQAAAKGLFNGISLYLGSEMYKTWLTQQEQPAPVLLPHPVLPDPPEPVVHPDEPPPEALSGAMH